MKSVHINNEGHELERAYLKLLDEPVEQWDKIVYHRDLQGENNYHAIEELRNTSEPKVIDHSIY